MSEDLIGNGLEGALRFVAAQQNDADMHNRSLVKINGVDHTWRPVFDNRKKVPEAPTLKVRTLGALVEWIAANPDGLDTGSMVVHVADPTHVELIGAVSPGDHFKQRHIAAEAEAVVPSGVQMENWTDVDEVVVRLQAQFEATDDRDAVLSILGNLKSEQVVQRDDDGTTQTVTAKQGIVVSDEVKVPNPITLRPYRTFAEVAQPSSVFVLRLRDVGDGHMQAKLAPADGGKWKLDAIAYVANWLKDNLEVPEMPTVIG